MNYKNRKMTIGLVLSNTPGYSETFFLSKIKGLQKKGFKVILFVDNFDPKFTLCEVKKAASIHKGNPLLFLLDALLVFFQFLWFPNAISRFLKLERKEGTKWKELLKKLYLNAHILTSKVDWLHFGFATLAIKKEQLAKSIQAKMAVSFRGYDINVYPLKHPNCYHLLWKRVDKIHSISNSLLKKAYTLGMPKDIKNEIITPAVSLKNVPSLTTHDSNKIKLITIARLNWIKDIETAVWAMLELKKKHVNFEYHIVGGGNEAENERCKFLVHQLKLKNQIIFHGKLPHAKSLELLSESTLYLQPSLNEGFCNAVLEAQALGLLCIVSDGGALPENVLDGKTGWVFPKGNSQALAKLVLTVNSLSNAEKEIISIQAKKRVLEKFMIEQQIEKFLNFYR